MTIKHTKSKGYSIVTNLAEVVLDTKKLTVLRKEENEDEDDYVIDSPGEYEVNQVAVIAEYLHDEENDMRNDSLSFVIDADNFIIGYLPEPPETIGEKVLPEYEVVDILMLPGEYEKIVNQLAPPIVIPLDNVQKLAEKLASEVPEETSSFTVNSTSDLPEETELINLR